MLVYALTFSAITIFVFLKSGDYETPLVILRVCAAVIATWILCYFSNESGRDQPSQISTLEINRPYEVCAHWYDGVSYYAIFKPLIAPGEKFEEGKHRQRFIDLGYITLPSKFVVPTSNGNAFTFQPFPEEKVPARADSKVRYKHFEKLEEIT